MGGLREALPGRDGGARTGAAPRPARRAVAPRGVLGRLLLRGRVALPSFAPARAARRSGRPPRMSWRDLLDLGRLAERTLVHCGRRLSSGSLGTRRRGGPMGVLTWIVLGLVVGVLAKWI